jgi:biopolymer transport protein ExbD
MGRKKRSTPEINAGSMADIAFLLLIFFLVTTTMDVDKGLMVKLAPWTDEPPPEDNKIKEKNITCQLINYVKQQKTLLTIMETDRALNAMESEV